MDSALSPELVLVDPALAERARASLLTPEDTLERMDRILRTQRTASLTKQIDALGSADSGLVALRNASGQRRFRAWAGSMIAAALVAVLLAGLLAGVQVDLRGIPAGAKPVTVAELPASRLGTTARPARPAPVDATPTEKSRSPLGPAHASLPRRFVWAPVERASGYRVELFGGSSLVFSARTTRAEVSIPTRWTFAGQRRTLEPGEYHWYVWPVVSGRRASEAIVQAKLVVPRR